MAARDLRDSIFSISASNNYGMDTYSWVEKHGSKYVLWNVEIGRISDPCSSVSEALSCDDSELSADYCSIYASISPEEMEAFLISGHIFLSDVEILRINDREIETRDINSIVDLYSSTMRKKQKKGKV